MQVVFSNRNLLVFFATSQALATWMIVSGLNNQSPGAAPGGFLRFLETGHIQIEIL